MTFEADAFRRALAPVPWVRDVHALERTTSTNDEAMRLAASGAPEGTVVVADTQTAGRGRMGRTWWSEPGTTLLVSWVLRPSEPPEGWPLYGVAAGVAAADAIRASSGLAAGLKWPNDVMAGERKLGGLLAEARPPDFGVIGLGLNLSCAIPDDLAGTATSIHAAGGRVPERPVLLAAILEGFSRFIEPSTALPRYRELCLTTGHQVRVARGSGEDVLGAAVRIDDRGALVVATDGGEVCVQSGEAFHVRPV